MGNIYIAESKLFDNYCISEASNPEEAEKEASKIFGTGTYSLNTIEPFKAYPKIYFPRAC